MSYRHAAYLAMPLLALAGLAAPAGAQSVAVGRDDPALDGTTQTQTQPYEIAQQTVVIAPTAPPAAQVETIPPPPAATSQTAYWQPGHWTWSGATWVWSPGAYVVRPQPTAMWVPGQWMNQAGGGYVWVDGHWQS